MVDFILGWTQSSFSHDHLPIFLSCFGLGWVGFDLIFFFFCLFIVDKESVHFYFQKKEIKMLSSKTSFVRLADYVSHLGLLL